MTDPRGLGNYSEVGDTETPEIELADGEEPPAGRQTTVGWQTTVHRAGDTLRRSASPWSESVIDLLAHLDRIGFRHSPRPIGSGFDADGNELLSYVPGESPQPSPWDDDAIIRIGRMLAELHVAAATFDPTAPTVWQDWFGRNLGDPTQGFGHGDLGPWNIMAVDGLPTGFIDWDTAGPIDPVYELAQAAWLNVQLHDDDVAERVGLGDVHQRAHQLRAMLDAYGLAPAKRIGFVDKMVEVAVQDSAAQAIDHTVTPDTTTGTAENGYPFVWGIAWRVRAAGWMLRNRKLLESAIDSPSC